MKSLIWIPARAGSTRVPGKSIKRLGEKPLINWTIDIAKELGANEVWVDSDCPVCGEIAKTASIKFRERPEYLSGAYVGVGQVFTDFLKWHEWMSDPPDVTIQMYPTYPFRNSERMKEMFELLKSGEYALVQSVERRAGVELMTGHFIGMNSKGKDRYLTCRIGNGAEKIDIDTPEDFELAEAWVK